MIRTNRWINVVALTIALMMVSGLPLWAQGDPGIVDYSKLQRFNNLATKAYSLMKKGKYQEAVKPAEEVLKLAEKIFEKDHDAVEVALNNLAIIYKELGRYDEAEPLYKRVLKIDEELMGPNHHEVASILNNLAVLYAAKGEYAKAERDHKRALVIREEVFGPDSPPVAQTLNNLGFVYGGQGRYAEAEAVYQRSLAIKERFPGPQKLGVARTLNNLAFVYKDQGKYSEAEPLYKRALVIYEKAKGPDHPYVATALNNLAELYKAQGQHTKAEHLFQGVLANREKSLGPNHPRVANMLKNMAKIYREMGRDDEAKKMLARSKRSALGISKSSEIIGKMTPTELIQAMEEKDGIRFKVMMTSGADDDNDPIDFKTKFSVNDDDKMSVFVYWPDRVGDHRVTIIWITPDQGVYAYNIYDTTFKKASWKTWFWKKTFKNMPTGVWTFELYLDGKPLVAKKFTVTLDKVDETKKLLTRAKPSARGNSKSSEKIGEITPKEFIQEMEEKEGIRFKVTMTSGVENNRPIDFKTQFSVNDDDRMYVFVYWPHRVGDHRVTVIWITPDQVMFAENILDMTFKATDWRTWQWQKIYKAMPKGDWTFELQLDGKYLVTKKFTVTN